MADTLAALLHEEALRYLEEQHLAPPSDPAAPLSPRQYREMVMEDADIYAAQEEHAPSDPAAPLREALLLAVEEVDNAWFDVEVDRIEWRDDLPSRLLDLRNAYGDYLEAERAATPAPKEADR